MRAKKTEVVCGIYKIRNTVTDKVYIGSAVSIYHRWRKHREMLRRSKHHSIKLQRSWSKHGEHSFEWEVIEVCPEEALIEREQFFLDQHNSAHDGYNMSTVADRVRPSEESRRRMSAAQKARQAKRPQKIKEVKPPKPILSEEDRKEALRVRRKRYYEAFKIRHGVHLKTERTPMSEEARQRARDRIIQQNAQPKSPEIIAKIAASNTGKRRTPEVRRSMSETRKGTKSPERTPEQRDNYRKAALAAYGRKRVAGEQFTQSPELIKKRITGIKAYYASGSDASKQQRVASAARMGRVQPWLKRSRVPKETVMALPPLDFSH